MEKARRAGWGGETCFAHEKTSKVTWIFAWNKRFAGGGGKEKKIDTDADSADRPATLGPRVSLGTRVNSEWGVTVQRLGG